MHRTPPGRTITVSTQDEPFQAVVPAPLPPMPPVLWDAALRRRFDDALVAMGRLDAVSAMLPNAPLVLYSFVRKEAVLSSQSARLGRAATSAWAEHEALQRQPVASASALGQATALAPTTVNTALARLQRLGIVDESTARRRGRVFAYSRYVTLLNTEPGDSRP